MRSFGQGVVLGRAVHRIAQQHTNTGDVPQLHRLDDIAVHVLEECRRLVQLIDSTPGFEECLGRQQDHTQFFSLLDVRHSADIEFNHAHAAHTLLVRPDQAGALQGTIVLQDIEQFLIGQIHILWPVKSPQFIKEHVAVLDLVLHPVGQPLHGHRVVLENVARDIRLEHFTRSNCADVGAVELHRFETCKILNPNFHRHQTVADFLRRMGIQSFELPFFKHITQRTDRTIACVGGQLPR